LGILGSSYRRWYEETYFLGYEDFVTPDLIYWNLEKFQDMMIEKQGEIDEVNNRNGYLQVSIDQISDARFELMRVLKEKEGLSINLAEKTDEVGRMAMENERLRQGIDDVRSEAKDLISTGMSYIEYTNSQGGGHMSG
jgi:hypothetical protein